MAASKNFYKRSKAITDEVGDVIEGLKTNQTKRVSEMLVSTVKTASGAHRTNYQ